MYLTQQTRHYLRSGMIVALGAAVVTASKYLATRMNQNQEVDARLERIERALASLMESQSNVQGK